MLRFIFTVLIDMLVKITELFVPVFDGILSFNVKSPHDLSGQFIKESEILSKRDKGFCITGKKNLSVKDSYRNALIIGNTGTGKSVTVLIPCILSMESSLIINDPSGELYEQTAGYKAKSGFRILVLDYSNPEVSVRYNPIARASTKSEMAKVAATLIRASLGDQVKDPFWTLQSVDLLVLMVGLAKGMDDEYQNLSKVRYLIQVMTGDPKKMDRLMAKYGSTELITAYRSFVAMSPKTFSSIAATALAALNLFQDEKVQQVTAKDTLKISEFRKHKTILYIKNSIADMKYYAPLTSVLAEQLFATVMNTIPKKGKGQDIFFLFDEAASLILPSLQISIANIRKYRSGILLAIQDFRQLVHNYGKNEAEAIKSNTYCKVYFTGQNLETARELEALMGKYTFEEQEGKKQSRSLLTVDEIRTIPVNKAIVVCGHFRPILATMHPFYKNRRLLRKTLIPPPKTVVDADSETASIVPIPKK